MIYLEIIMIIIGLGAIVFGVKLSEPEQNGTNASGTKTDWTKENKIWEEKLEEYQKKLTSMEEETVLNTEDRLNTVSNEKIMGINEYSDQVIDKIEKNHGEVVFLYNMLEEKKAEIQKMIQDADVTKAEFRDELAQSYQQSQELAKLLQQGLEDEEQLADTKSQETEEKKQKVLKSKDGKNVTQKVTHSNQKEKPQKEETEVGEQEERASSSGNKNDEIIRLHAKGYSVIEISKMLSLGQGEVKLVLDLFQ